MILPHSEPLKVLHSHSELNPNSSSFSWVGLCLLSSLTSFDISLLLTIPQTHWTTLFLILPRLFIPEDFVLAISSTGTTLPSDLSMTTCFVSRAQSSNITTSAMATNSEVVSDLLTPTRSHYFNLFIFCQCLLTAFPFPGTDLSMEHVLIHFFNPSNNPNEKEAFSIIQCYRRRNQGAKGLNKLFKVTSVKGREAVIETQAEWPQSQCLKPLPGYSST